MILGFSLAVCSPLVYIYSVETKEDGDVVCLTTTRGNIVPQIYYSLHTTFFFVIPLLYMIFTQSRIFRALRTNSMPVSNSFISKSNQRHIKVAKTLAALTIAFVFCWSPFMITRTLIYSHLASLGLFWRVSQLSIFLNADLANNWVIQQEHFIHQKPRQLSPSLINSVKMLIFHNFLMMNEINWRVI